MKRLLRTAGKKQRIDMNLSKLYETSYEFISLGISIGFSPSSKDGLGVTILEEIEDDVICSEYVAFEVTSVASYMRNNEHMDIFDEEGNEMAYLIIGNYKSIEIQSSSNWLVATVLYYLLRDQLDNGAEDVVIRPDFESSYAIEDRSLIFVKLEQIENFERDYKQGCEIWGNFSLARVHKTQAETATGITARPNVKLPTQEHKIKAYYAVTSENAFTRFLNKYHIIELLFNYQLVARLRVARSDISEFRDIMESYSSGKEIESLKNIICNYVNDTSTLIEKIYKFSNFKGICEKIFQQSNKESNLLKANENWEAFWNALSAQKLQRVDVAADKQYKFSSGKEKSDGEYKNVMCTIVAYWIYRIRCSIAHNKISEFIFSDSDEDFIFEAAEPLLDEVLVQLLANQDLAGVLHKSMRVERFLYATEPD